MPGKNKLSDILAALNASNSVSGAAPTTADEWRQRLEARRMRSRTFDPSGPPEEPQMPQSFAPSGAPTAEPQAMADQSQPPVYHGAPSGPSAPMAAILRRRSELEAAGLDRSAIMQRMAQEGLIDPRWAVAMRQAPPPGAM